MKLATIPYVAVALGLSLVSLPAQARPISQGGYWDFDECMLVECLLRGYGYDYCTTLCKRAAGIDDEEKTGGGKDYTRPAPGRNCYGQQEPCNVNIQ